MRLAESGRCGLRCRVDILATGDKMSTDFLGNRWPDSCMGCLIASGEMVPPGGILLKTDHFHLHQDPLIPLPGFLVLGANRHIQRIQDLSGEEFREYARILQRARSVIDTFFDVRFVTMIEEECSPHFHTWFFPWTEQLLQSVAHPSLSAIRPIMESYRGRIIDPEEWLSLEGRLRATASYLQIEGRIV